MATVTANKHGLRKAAEEKRNRHAQRTPLPPKGGVEPVEVPANAEAYGRMSLNGLLRRATELGIDPPAKPTKGKLLTAILAHERTSSPTSSQMKAVSVPETREDRIRAAQAKKLAKRQAEDAARAASVEPAEDVVGIAVEASQSSRSAAKAAPVREIMGQHGWSTILVPAEGTTAEEDVWELTGKRGSEVLWISWTKGTLTTEPMPSYTIEDRTIKLRNASAVKQYAERAPETGAAELARVASNRFFRRRPEEPQRAPLPFDPRLATDEEVLANLTGKAVSWHNQYRVTQEAAQVGVRGGRQPIEIKPSPSQIGDRIVSFCCPATGFRAFRLSQLTRVGSRRFRTRGEQNSGAYEPVEVE